MVKTRYAIALGSNRRHHRHGSPREVLKAAIATLDASRHLSVEAVAPIFNTIAIGPAGRGFANTTILVKSDRKPDKVLKIAKAIEWDFGRRSGRRWGPRVLDIDIILWSGGMWSDNSLAVPHPAFRIRRFVLDPLVRIAADWRDPLSGLHVRHLHARLSKPKPVDPRRAAA